MDNPLVQPDPGLFIWTIVTFLVLLALLAKFAWRPLLDALEKRQESILKSLDDALQAKQELERLHVESAQIIRQARVEAEGQTSQRPVAVPLVYRLMTQACRTSHPVSCRIILALDQLLNGPLLHYPAQRIPL